MLPTVIDFVHVCLAVSRFAVRFLVDTFHSGETLETPEQLSREPLWERGSRGLHAARGSLDY